MKKIETVISERAFLAVCELLMAQGHDIAVSEVREHDRGCTLHYRRIAYRSYETRLKIETVVADADAMSVVHAILTTSPGLDPADSTVDLSPLKNVLSIAIMKLENQPGSVIPEIVKNATTPLPGPSQHAPAV